MKKFFQSFGFAASGLAYMAAHERNFRVQLVCAVLVLVLGILTGLSFNEWAVLVAMIGLVLSAEASNSALEHLADALHPEKHPSIGAAKDAAAGAVLIIAMVAVVVGLAVFLPHWRAA